MPKYSIILIVILSIWIAGTGLCEDVAEEKISEPAETEKPESTEAAPATQDAETAMPAETNKIAPPEIMPPAEKTAAETIVPETSQESIIWIEGNLPGKYETKGNWIWDKNVRQADTASHIDGDKRPRREHSFITDAAVELNGESKIIQYLYCDPKESPKGIMLRLISAEEDSPQITVYWEGEEEVFTDTDEYRKAWYMGVLPRNGEWEILKIDCKELDITKVKLKGIGFIVSNGNVYWGKTVIEGGRCVKEETQGQAEMAQ